MNSIPSQQPPSPQIVIHGAGIAGLWLLNRLKTDGYDVLLLEKNTIGGGQSIASQGIIHSGLKYALAGKVNDLARTISAMPDRWRDSLNGTGEVDLATAQTNAQSQQLLIPTGFMGGLIKLVTSKTLSGVEDVPQNEWPSGLQDSGYKGSAVRMGEPVLDIPSMIKALAKPHMAHIRHTNTAPEHTDALHIYTAAQGNAEAAQVNAHDTGLRTQARPLLMCMIKNAPFPLYAHFVGKSEKPIASITTHKTHDGALVWYIGGGVAERAKDSDLADLFRDTSKAIKKFLPAVDQSNFEWAALPIDRIEGKSNTSGWMPDTPTIHDAGGALYCWPTKLTFAPMLADMVIEKLNARGITPNGQTSDFSALPSVDYAAPPWDKAVWRQISGQN